MNKLWYCGAALLLWSGCGRPRSEQRPGETHSRAAEPVVVPVARTAEPARPSPFREPDAPALPRPAEVTQPPRKATALSSGLRSPKPWKPPAEPEASRIVADELPAPPILPRLSRSSEPNLTAGLKAECMATATYEPVTPNVFRRVIHKVPGLKRLQHSAETSDGFLPPHPAQDITFWLPPGISPGALQRNRMDLKATVDPSGGVSRVELLAPKDEQLLTMAAYAAREWRFVPARLDDHAVASQIVLHFRFDNH